MPSLWHGPELNWRPKVKSLDGWGKTVDFEDYKDGYSEAVNKPPIEWGENFKIGRLGEMSTSLINIDDKWCDYLRVSLTL
ncbi:MAG: hypothetical protein GY839_03645 [candidate division Zixibacteria bacterium]|nr:hypothetical protein [candidate division Zixibacteria bacterium]